MAIGLLAAAALFSTGYVVHDVTSPDTTTIQRASDPGSGADLTSASLPSGETPTVSGNSIEPVADVAAAVGPAVVQINTEQGLGSGTIYDASGLILTNNHVVSGYTDVTVRLADGSSYEGQVLGTDSRSDIAVVQIQADKDLPVAQLATEDAAVGQTAIALGSPFGLTQSVTAGIVSAVDRPVANERGVAVNMLQTDAPINPGNSGGALANRFGQIIGVPTSIFSESGENNGIGFAVPIDTAKKIADKIVAGESLAPAQLGIAGGQTASDQVGAVVGEVSGAAAEAGIEVGDVIVSVDGQQVQSIESLQGIIGTHSPGDTITVEVDRDGVTKTLDVTLGAASSTSNGSGSSGSRNPGSPTNPTNPFGN